MPASPCLPVKSAVSENLDPPAKLLVAEAKGTHRDQGEGRRFRDCLRLGKSVTILGRAEAGRVRRGQHGLGEHVAVGR